MNRKSSIQLAVCTAGPGEVCACLAPPLDRCSARPTQVADAVLGDRWGGDLVDVLCGVDVGSASRVCLESVVGNQSVTPLTTGIAQTIDWTLSLEGRGPRGSEPLEIP